MSTAAAKQEQLEVGREMDVLALIDKCIYNTPYGSISLWPMR